MKASIRLALIICIVLPGLSTTAKAGCDSCLQAAFQAANASQAAALAGLTTAVNGTTASVNALNGTISGAGSAIASAISSGSSAVASNDSRIHMDFKATFEGAAGGIEVELAKQAATIENLNDHLIQSINTMVTNTLATIRTDAIDRQFGENSMPVTGNIAPERAAPVSEGLAQSRQMEVNILRRMHEYNDVAYYTTTESMPDLYRDLADRSFDFFSPVPWLTQTRLNDQQFADAQELLMYVTNLEPLPRMASEEDELAEMSSGVQEYETQRRMFNAQLEVVQGVLARDLASRAEVIDADWIDGTRYEYLIQGHDGLISREDFMRAEGLSRLVDPDWYMDMKRMNTTGLKREQTYIQGAQNMLLAEINELEQDLNRLLAIQSLADLQREREELRR